MWNRCGAILVRQKFQVKNRLPCKDLVEVRRRNCLILPSLYSFLLSCYMNRLMPNPSYYAIQVPTWTSRIPKSPILDHSTLQLYVCPEITPPRTLPPHSLQRMSQTLAIRPFSASSSILSLDSQRTTTDTSTVWGPGTVSGRALLALGEVTIRGIDALLIRRRLATIRLRSPALSASMCDDLLELCRPAMYSPRIQKEAVRLVLTQICVDLKYSMLVLALCKWPEREAYLILHVLMANLSEPLHPSGWQLKGMADFLVAIIQAKEQWENIVVNAALLLRGDFQVQPLASHPIHILCSEIAPNAREPLSTLQKSYSSHMRSETWLSLHTCGLDLQDRMLRIENIVNQISNPDLSPQLLDAISDAVIFTRSDFDFELQSLALSCLRKIHGARWKPVCEFFEFPSGEIVSELRRTDFNLQRRRELSTSEVADAHAIMRKVSSNASHNMWDKMVKLCLRTRYPSQITNAAILLTLRNICQGSVSSRIHISLGVCKLVSITGREMIRTLVQDVPLVLCSLTSEEKILAIRSFCDFLAGVFQIKGDYKFISSDVATAIVESGRNVEHPVISACSKILESNQIIPFSKIQAMYSNDGRHVMWIALEAGGFRLDARMLEVTDILASTHNLSTPKLFDALADAVIFTSELFSPELRSSATNCLIDHCVQSRRWEILQQVFAFDYETQNLMFKTLRDRLSQDELSDFVRTYPTDNLSDLFLLLSGWVIGLQYDQGRRRAMD
ncbi:hypothetical protein C8R44DRAFT_771742 [Mycena epipterygia]|nr:hypothetical protein C8R44DRAFT_771742 [Mycena epipterygia]